MASHYYIRHIGRNVKKRHTYDVLLKEEVDYNKHDIVFVAEDAQWIAFIHKYKAKHIQKVVRNGKVIETPIHPLNDNIPPQTLKGMYEGRIEF